MTEVMTKPICKTVNCRRELTYLEKSDCWRCLVCNPLHETVPTIEPEKKYVDVKMTEEKVREIVRDELENWHIQKPLVTKSDIGEMTATEMIVANSNLSDTVHLPPNWRQQAKDLGIELFHKKKVDVLAEIESRKVQVG